MNVAVIGAGKMGLPLACQFAARGAHVYACDANRSLVEAINRGETSIDEPGVAELLASAVREGRLSATCDTPAAVRESDVVVVIVPALLNEHLQADLSVLLKVTRQIAEALRPGVLVSYETTVPVGTTRTQFVPILQSSGLRLGTDLFVAFSPERVKSRLVLERLTRNLKVVGGVDEASGRRAEAFYQTYLGAPVADVGSAEAAELLKLAGMIYRDVAIALSNELARYAEAVGVDFSQLIGPTNTDAEANLLLPGIGVGGHCAPVYPYFVIHDARRRGASVTLAEQARYINDGQARHVVMRLERLLGGLRGLSVLILGLGFRPGVREHVCSTCFLLQPELQRRGAAVLLHDDLYSDEEIASHGFVPGKLEAAPAPDAIILSTAHETYLSLDFAGLAANGLKAVVDGRNLWDPQIVRRHGLVYIGVGRP